MVKRYATASGNAGPFDSQITGAPTEKKNADGSTMINQTHVAEPRSSAGPHMRRPAHQKVFLDGHASYASRATLRDGQLDHTAGGRRSLCVAISPPKFRHVAAAPMAGQKSRAKRIPRRAAANCFAPPPSKVWMTRRRLLLALAALLAPAQLPGARAGVKLAYRHTSKTGGLYINKMLMSTFSSDQFVRYGETLDVALNRSSSLYLIGSVRNPCGWLASWWGYAWRQRCQRMYTQPRCALTSANENPNFAAGSYWDKPGACLNLPTVTQCSPTVGIASRISTPM